jgi:UDP-glucose 4-epimerase
MKILVTGSEGSIGQFIVQQLYASFEKVEVIRIGRTKHEQTDGKSRYYWGDLSDSQLCERIFAEERIDYVVACAARWSGLNQDPQILSNNISTIDRLLGAVTDSVKNIIFVSSSAIYQSCSPFEDTVIDEQQESSYGASKWAGEKLVQLYSRFKGFDYTIYRPFHVVSPAEPFERGRSHVCTDMCHRIIGNGEHIDLDKLPNDNGIGFFWVEDMANIVVDGLLNPATCNEIFNIGTNDIHSVRELANEIIKVAHHYQLIERTPEDIEREVTPKPDLYGKLTTTCGSYELTPFSDCVEKFIRMRYLHGMYDV